MQDFIHVPALHKHAAPLHECATQQFAGAPHPHPSLGTHTAQPAHMEAHGLVDSCSTRPCGHMQHAALWTHAARGLVDSCSTRPCGHMQHSRSCSTTHCLPSTHHSVAPHTQAAPCTCTAPPHAHAAPRTHAAPHASTAPNSCMASPMHAHTAQSTHTHTAPQQGARAPHLLVVLVLEVVHVGYAAIQRKALGVLRELLHLLIQRPRLLLATRQDGVNVCSSKRAGGPGCGRGVHKAGWAQGCAPAWHCTSQAGVQTPSWSLECRAGQRQDCRAGQR